MQELDRRVTTKISVKGNQAAATRHHERRKIRVGPLPGAQVKVSGPLPSKLSKPAGSLSKDSASANVMIRSYWGGVLGRRIKVGTSRSSAGISVVTSFGPVSMGSFSFFWTTLFRLC